MAEEKEFGEPGTYEGLFEECFSEFQKSGYDLALILSIEKKIVAHMQALARKTGKPQKLIYPIRLAMEYIVRRVPKEERILQELLLERIRDLWKQRHLKMEKDNNQELLKQFGQTLEKTVNNAIWKVFYELRAYGVIPRYRIEILEDGTIIYPEETQDAEHEFGTVKDKVLTWTAVLNQLARVIHILEPHLGYDSLSAGEICKRIEATGVIKLARGKLVTVEKALEKIHARKADFGTEDFVHKAAGIILILMEK